MQKSTFENFIKKYSLDGLCEASHWYSDAEKKTLTARAHTPTKTVILKIVLKKWEENETFQIAFPSSSKIRKMLGPINEDISFTLGKINDRICNFTVSDPDCEAVFAVALNDAFPETLDTDKADLPSNFDVSIELDDLFIGRLMKAMTALNDSKDFVLMNNKKGGLDLILNYEDTNTNRIRIPVKTSPGKDKIDIQMGFSTEVLKAIINSNLRSNKSKVEDLATNNSDISTLNVSSKGIAIIKFEDELFKSTYFMFPTRVVE